MTIEIESEAEWKFVCCIIIQGGKRGPNFGSFILDTHMKQLTSVSKLNNTLKKHKRLEELTDNILHQAES